MQKGFLDPGEANWLLLTDNIEGQVQNLATSFSSIFERNGRRAIGQKTADLLSFETFENRCYEGFLEADWY